MIRKAVQESAQTLSSSTQYAQIVEAIKLADISTELNKQTLTLQKLAADHGIQHDEQLQKIQDLHNNIDIQFQSPYAKVSDTEQAVAAASGAHTLSEGSSYHRSIDRLTSAIEAREDNI